MRENDHGPPTADRWCPPSILHPPSSVLRGWVAANTSFVLTFSGSILHPPSSVLRGWVAANTRFALTLSGSILHPPSSILHPPSSDSPPLLVTLSPCHRI